MSVCYGIEDFHTAKKTKAGVVKILSALIAAAIFPVFCQKIVKAFACLKKNSSANVLADIRQCGSQKNILGTPDSPVIHMRFAVSHPPEMLVQVRNKDTFGQGLIKKDRNSRTDCIQLLL